MVLLLLKLLVEFDWISVKLQRLNGGTMYGCEELGGQLLNVFF